MVETKRFPLQPGCGPVYSKLFQLLSETPSNRLTDEAISAAAGVDCRVGTNGYGTLCRVIKAVERSGRVWRRERGAQSMRLLKEDEKVTHTSGITSKAGRLVKRGATIVGTVDMNQLTNEQRIHANAVAAHVGALVLLSKPNVTKKIEVRNNGTTMDASAVLELISGKALTT